MTQLDWSESKWRMPVIDRECVMPPRDSVSEVEAALLSASSRTSWQSAGVHLSHAVRCAQEG